MQSRTQRRNFIEKSGVIIGCILIANNIAFIPSIGAIYYLIMLFALFIMLNKSSQIRMSGIMIWLYVACIMSIILMIFLPFPSLYAICFLFYNDSLVVSIYCVCNLYMLPYTDLFNDNGVIAVRYNRVYFISDCWIRV